MLTMKVELWPFGDESAAKILVTITLANMGRSKGDGYDYLWTIDEPDPLYDAPIKAQGLIENYDRNASCVSMLAAILDDYRNPKVTQLNNQDMVIVDRLREKSKPTPPNRWPY